MGHEGSLILAAGLLLALGLAASLLAGRLRIPGLVLFLGVGMLVGSDGLGLIAFNDYELARTIGIIALALILFEGGLAAGFQEIRPVLGSALSLATLGTLVTAVVTGLAAYWLLDLTLLQGMLVGAIVSATDGAAIFALLRGSTLKRRLARTLEGEAGHERPRRGAARARLHRVDQAPGLRHRRHGAAVRPAARHRRRRRHRRRLARRAGLPPRAPGDRRAVPGRLARRRRDRVRRSPTCCTARASSRSTSPALRWARRNLPARQTVHAFHDGLAWVAQLAMFLALGLLVFPHQLDDIAWQGTLIALVLVFVARPLAVVVATAFAPLGLGDRLVLGWAGLRGAVPVVLATFPVIEGVDDER